MDFIVKPAHDLLGMPYLMTLDPVNWPTGTPSALHASPPHTHTPWQQPVHALEGDACELLETASEYAQKAGPTLWDWKRAHKFEHLALPYRKQVGGCQHPPFFYKIKRRHTILRTPTPPQEGTRSVEQDCP